MEQVASTRHNVLTVTQPGVSTKLKTLRRLKNQTRLLTGLILFWSTDWLTAERMSILDNPPVTKAQLVFVGRLTGLLSHFKLGQLPQTRTVGDNRAANCRK